jgi:hypothetical protein
VTGVQTCALPISRRLLPLSDKTHRSLSYSRLLGFILPYRIVKGPSQAGKNDPGFEETHIYCGLFALIVAMFGLIFMQGRTYVFFALLFIFSLLFMLGKNHVVYPLLYYPLARIYPSRSPIRASWLATFSLSVLCGIYLNAFKVNAYLQIYAILIVFWDLYYHNSKIHSYKRVNPNDRFPILPRVKFLLNDKTDFLVYAEDDDILKNNWGSVYGIKNIRGYAPLVDRGLDAFFNTKDTEAVFRELNVKYVVCKHQDINKGKIVFKDGKYNVFRLDYWEDKHERLSAE